LLFNYFAQTHKLIHALMWLHVAFSFKIVHRGGADRTLNLHVLIEHRKLNDHPIEVEAPHLTSPQRHCEFSTLKEVIVQLQKLLFAGNLTIPGPKEAEITEFF
jgi:hypothetical protein